MATVDIRKKRDVAIVRVQGVFLASNIYKEVLLVLQGRLEKLMAKTEPIIYCKYVPFNRSHTVNYVQLKK